MTSNTHRYIINLRKNNSIWSPLFCLAFVLLFSLDAIAKSEESDIASGRKNSQCQEITLVDFERGIPCSHDGDPIGFRKQDKSRCTVVQDGAEGTRKSAVFKIGPKYRDIYIYSGRCQEKISGY